MGYSVTAFSLPFSYFGDFSFLINSLTKGSEVPASVITGISFVSDKIQ